MDSHTLTATAATHPDSTTNPNNLIEFRPRASSLAVQALVAAGVSEADEALGRVLADHARFATQADTKRWHVAPGEVFMMTGGSCGGTKQTTVEAIAGKMGLAVQTIHNRRSSLKRRGVIDVRRCSQTRCSIVFRVPGTLPPASWRPVVKAGGRSESKTDGKTDQEPRTEPMREPVARATCHRCGRSWPMSYGFRCRSCERDTREPCASPVQNLYGDDLRCGRCCTCRPDRAKCAISRPKDGEPCIYVEDHDGQHRGAR